MTNVYSFDGVIIFALLVICTTAYLRKIPKIRDLFLSEKKGFLGIFYKASVVGIRLHIAVASCCVASSLYLLLIK
ncbi:protein kish-B-like [Centruroides sculpturatus]|uniref:protein kish-B-like n=1 Tax=Centruroides sculpturatus TaxID=218467 RepID=UPI000C6DD4A6|nr:protein kish-B-like [Centruroides sculpturatus]